MEELKHYDIKDIESIDDERAKDAKPGQVINCTRVYIKSEADKVIAELKDKLKVQTSLAEEWLKLEDTYRTSYAEAVKELFNKNKEIHHQKYKRCLAKAERCKDKIENAVQYNEHDDWLIINEYWERWLNRWLKIAEQFNEAK